MNPGSGVVIVMLAVAVFVYLELLPMLKGRQFKAAAVYSLLLAGGTTLAVCAVRLIYIPSPMWLVVIVFGPLAKALGLAG